MKTAMKITAIAVITVLALLSCVPEVTLTDRDYSERNSAADPEYTNSPGGTGYLPSVFGSTYYPYYSNGSLIYRDATTLAATEDIRKESKISFTTDNAKKADVFKADNDNIETELKGFLTLWQYTNPTTPPAASVPWTPSNLTTQVNYTFVRRDGADIIVKVDVPDIDYIVYKIDASQYKIFGQSFDRNNDGIVDEYDDYYGQISISGSTKHITDGGAAYTDNFFDPVGSVTLRFDDFSGRGFNATTRMPYLFTIVDGRTSGSDSAYMRAILSDLLPKIEIQKYNKDDDTWVKDGTVALYNNTTPPPTGETWTTDLIYGSFTPADLGIYRLAATGIANLTTSANYGATGKPAKIKISGVGYLVNSYYSNPVVFYNADFRQWETANPIEKIVVRSDSDKKNVVLDVFFYYLTDNKTIPSSKAYLAEMSTEDFNKNFKLVYLKDNEPLNEGEIFYETKYWDGSPYPALVELKDIVELKVTDVKYSTSKYLHADATNTNCITITLDPSYQIVGNRIISFLITTGFKYTGGHVTFGSRTTPSYFSNSFFWRSYQAAEMIMTDPGSDYEPAIPGTPAIPAYGDWYWDDTDDDDSFISTFTHVIRTDDFPGDPTTDIPDLATGVNGSWRWQQTSAAIPAVPEVPEVPARPPHYELGAALLTL